MKKRLIAFTLILVLALGLFTACGKKSGAVTTEQALAAAFADAGVSAAEAGEPHVHLTEKNGVPCYSIHFTANGQEYSILISAADGSVVGYGH